MEADEDPPARRPRFSWLLRPLYVVPALFFGLLFGIPFLFRMVLIYCIPDVGDPFDVAKFSEQALADEDNACTWYRRAAAELKPVDSALMPQLDVVLVEGWPAATEKARVWLEENRKGIELVRRGSRLATAQNFRPSERQIDPGPPMSHNTLWFSHSLGLEAARLEAAGDLSGAWEVHHALLRVSRHICMYGSTNDRLFGFHLHRAACTGILRWSRHPGLDSALLRRAVAEARESFALTPLPSEALKVDYILFCDQLRDPAAPNRYRGLSELEEALGLSFVETRIGPVGLYLAGEPAVSLRVTRLKIQNLLAQCDLSPVPAGVGSSYLFPPNPRLTGRRQLTPAEIDAYDFRTVYSSAEGYGPYYFFEVILQEAVAQADLVVALALQAYHRDHGEFPVDLDALLEGYADPHSLEPFGYKGNWIYYRRTADGASLQSTKVEPPRAE